MKALLIYIPAILTFVVLSMYIIFDKYRVLSDNIVMGTYVTASVFISFCMYFYILNLIFIYSNFADFTEIKRMALSAVIPVILFGLVSVIDVVKPPSGLIALGWKHVLLFPGAEITNSIRRYLR